MACIYSLKILTFVFTFRRINRDGNNKYTNHTVGTQYGLLSSVSYQLIYDKHFENKEQHLLDILYVGIVCFSIFCLTKNRNSPKDSTKCFSIKIFTD